MKLANAVLKTDLKPEEESIYIKDDVDSAEKCPASNNVQDLQQTHEIQPQSSD